MKLDIKNKTKILNEKLKDRLLKDRDKFSKVTKNIQSKIQNFYAWVKGAELVELEKCDIKDDPVRPELSNEFRTSYGRKIYGVKYQNEIHAVMCFAFTNQIPKTVNELDQLSKDAFLQSANRDQNVGKIAIAYTVWSKKKGGGKLIVKDCLLYTSPSPRDSFRSRMPSSA